MKLTPIIGIALAAAISSNAFAVEVTKGKVLKHKEWSTGKVKASYAKGSKTLAAMKQKIKLDGPVPTYTFAETRPVSVNAGDTFSISNDSFTFIHNNTSEVHYYTMESSICVERTDNAVECVYSWDYVELQPDGDITAVSMPTLTTSFADAGTYHTDASTYFSGGTQNKFFSNLSSSSATVIVS
jgi:hypothetical protein